MDQTRHVVGSPAGLPPPLPGAERDRLVRLAYRFLWDRDDAEDVAHEALLQAQVRQGGLRDPTAWWSWLCRIVVHKCHDLARGRRRRARHAPRLALRNAAREFTPVEHRPETSEASEAMRRALVHLPPRQKEVIVLRHLEGLSYEAIAELLAISPATARVHAKAGLEGLRTQLREHEPVEGAE